MKIKNTQPHKPTQNNNDSETQQRQWFATADRQKAYW